MNTERVLAERLLTRVDELYASVSLNYELPDFDGLTQKYDAISKVIRGELGVSEDREWNAYGCGFASFLDSWYYRKSEEFRWTYPGVEGESYHGVFVIYSLLEPMFAIGQGSKSWTDEGGSGYVPNLNTVDRFESESVKRLAERIRLKIRGLGVPQASRRTLNTLLASNVKIKTNLSHGKLTLFDAYFHWED